jgi:hypothetical protein
MIYAQPTSQERINIRYTIARLEPVMILISAVRIKMEQIALETTDKGLKMNILNFVSETGPCQEQIHSYIESCMKLFPVTDISPVHKNEQDAYQTNCPFECAKNYEKKIVKAFRAVINDYKVIDEIRQAMRTQLNEMLYAFMKIKMLRSFSIKELRADSNLF